MTDITFYVRSGDIIGFKSKGHAGYGKRGTDIVCASVSILLINTINSIEKLSGDKSRSVINERRATIDFEMDGDFSDGSRILLNSLKLGLEGIMAEYPGNVSLNIEEV